MPASPEKAERYELMLAELCELGLGLAREVQGQALTAKDAGETAELTLAFHRVARSVRQTIALDAKLDRAQERAAREARAETAKADSARRHARKARVRLAVEREVWSEYEGDEAEGLVDELGDLLDVEALDEDFAEGPIEAQIARIRDQLGLPPLGEGEGGAMSIDLDPAAWRSSA